MTRIATYARPSSLAEALRLLEPDGAVAVGGGTTLPRLRLDAAADAVDLQDLGLARIEHTGDTVLVGAMATLEDLRNDEELPAAVREAARRELPSTLRTQATVGGLVASAAADSELLAVLLVHEAVVTVASRKASTDMALPDYFSSLPRPRAEIVTAVSFRLGGRTATARTARTRADRPIVAAAARVAPDDSRIVALSGVAATPVVVDPGHLAGLDPPGDFRGSGEYRAALAEVLSARVLEEVS